MDLFARAVESVRSQAGADRVVVIGHSMGTPVIVQVIVQYARLYPRHVAAMVFVDGLLTPPNMGPADAPPPERQISGPNGIKGCEGIIRSMFSPATTPEMQKHILSMMLGAPEATAVGSMYATLDQAVWKGDVLPQPILGFYADKSALANREYMKTHFPNLQYVEIAGTGHFLMLEKPDEFNRLLLGFLGKQTF